MQTRLWHAGRRAMECIRCFNWYIYIFYMLSIHALTLCSPSRGLRDVCFRLSLITDFWKSHWVEGNSRLTPLMTDEEVVKWPLLNKKSSWLLSDLFCVGFGARKPPTCFLLVESHWSVDRRPATYESRPTCKVGIHYLKFESDNESWVLKSLKFSWTDNSSSTLNSTRVTRVTRRVTLGVLSGNIWMTLVINNCNTCIEST